MLQVQTLNISQRPRLFSLLDQLLDSNQIIWISGAPGSGKTVLAESYFATRGIPNLWLRLPNIFMTANDVKRFIYEEIQAAYPTLLDDGSSADSHNIDTSGMRLKTTIAKVTQTESEFPVLVFENYQQIPEDSPVHAAINDMRASLPKQSRLIILSRSVPLNEFVRLQAHGKLIELADRHLWFTLDEAFSLAASYRIDGHEEAVNDKEIVSQIMDYTQGWPVGLKLMLSTDSNGKGLEFEEIRKRVEPLIHAYFSTELLKAQDVSTRRLVFASAFLPQLDSELMSALSDYGDVAQLLTQLKRGDYFVDKFEKPGSKTQYYPLFHTFLKQKANQELTSEQIADIQLKAGVISEDKKDIETAATLFHATGAIKRLLNLISLRAWQLINQSRFETLSRWLSWLPSELFDKQPWLYCWAGLCRLLFDPTVARDHFEKAYSLFLQANDGDASYRAWAGIVESYLVEWGDLHPADRWITEYENLREHFPDFSSVEAQFAAYKILPLLILRCPTHPRMWEWAQRAQTFFHANLQHPQSLMLGMDLMQYFMLMGDVCAVDSIYALLEPRRLQFQANVAAEIFWHIMAAHYHWIKGDHRLSLQNVKLGLEISASNGILVFLPLLNAQAAYAHLVAGEVDQAESALKQVADTSRQLGYLNGGHYYFLKSKIVQQCNDLHSALKFAQLSIEMAEQAGAPLPTALSRLQVAHLHAQLGQLNQAEEQLMQVGQSAEDIDSYTLRFLGLVTRALIGIEVVNAAQCRESLAAAMALRRKIGGIGFGYWGPAQLGVLFAEALKAGFEVVYVRQLIEQYHLQPRTEDWALVQWPWPVRIYTFGRLSIVINGQALHFNGKGQRKPVEVLLFLLARGGREVSQTELCDTLWPDNEADAAYRTLITTLQRLRKLLDEPKAIDMTGGFVSLNNQYVWVDAWAFERLLNAATQITDPDDKSCDTLCEQALRLYKRPFLENIEDYWVIPLREKLRHKYRHHCSILCRQLEQQGQSQDIIELLYRAIDADDDDGYFHQQLANYLVKSNPFS